MTHTDSTADTATPPASTLHTALCRDLGMNDFASAGKRVLDEVLARTASRAGLVGLLTPDGRLRTIAEVGYDWSRLTGGIAEEAVLYRSEHQPDAEAARPARGPLAPLVASDDPFIIDHVDAIPHFASAVPGLGSLISVPLAVEGGGRGLLLLGGRDGSYTKDLLPPEDPAVRLASIVCSSWAHRAREDALQAEARHAQMMEMVGRLTGGIAHDFGNVLQLVRGTCEISIDMLPAESAVRTDLEDMLTVIDRATSLTRQLLSVGRQSTQAARETDLNQVISEHVPMLRRLLGNEVELTPKLAADLGKVRVDPGQIQQILLNLAINARDAMAKGGRLLVRTVNRQLEPPDGAAPTAPREHVMLEVTDSGCGMSREILSNIFDPYFTTKGAGRGTGLGLANVKVIVERFGGHIHVYSEPGLGTSFKIFLPRSDAQPVTVIDVTQAEATRKATILLVEDEAPVRTLAKSMLTRAGYRIVEAAGPEEALEAAARDKDPIDLVLTDLVLPGMTGQDLAVKLQAAQPAMKVLYMSGFTIHSAFVEDLSLGADKIIEKPFRKDLLLKRVREIIEG